MIILPKEFIQYKVYRELTPSDGNLYKAILELSLKEGYCYASQEYLAEQIFFTEVTITKAVKKLVALQLIQVTKSGASNGWSKNRYYPIQPLDYVNGIRAKSSEKRVSVNIDNAIPLNTFDTLLTYCLENYNGELDRFELQVKGKGFSQGKKSKCLKVWKEKELPIDEKVIWFVEALERTPSN